MNVYLAGTATDHRVNVSGCAFQGSGAYVPDPSRPYFGRTNTNATLTINTGCRWGTTIEGPPTWARYVRSSILVDFPYGGSSIPSGQTVLVTGKSVPGASMGDTVNVSYSAGQAGAILSGYVAAAGSVTITVSNVSASPITFPAGTFTVSVDKR